MNSNEPVGVDPRAFRKIHSNLSRVEETLLIPLYYRAKESRRRDAIIEDPGANQIVSRIEYDFSRFDPLWIFQLDIAIRTEIFDERVREFLRRFPQAVVVNLGAGLDGRFFRLDNGRVRWFDLDLPESMAFRRHFYSPSPRNDFISGNCFDFSWMDQVPRAVPLLVIAEGLFCYCDPADVQALFARLKEEWPGCEIVFQSICPGLVARQDLVPVITDMGAVFRWGIHDGREVCRWDPAYHFLGQWHYVDRHRRRWGSLRLKMWLPRYRRWFREVMKITQLRLGDPAASPAV